MADFYLHARLAETVTETINFDFNMPLVYIASQGPDPLYNVVNKEAKEYRYYADRMHDTNTNLLFKNMIQYVKKNITQDSYSFLIGFICHYALDVTIHPYVYYNTGVYNKKDPHTHQYRGLHLKFERSIDSAMIQKELGIPSRKFKPTKKYFPQYTIHDDIAKIMGYTLKQTYACDKGTEMYKFAVKSMYRVMKNYVTDRYGIKKQILKIVDVFSKDDIFLQDVSLFNHIKENVDFLNLSKQSWHHPITNEEFNFSVVEMFEQATKFAHDLIQKTDQYLKGEDINLDTVFTNLSFNSGMNCELHDDMKYFNNYLK